jgi:ribosomal RNA-processing protein 1
MADRPLTQQHLCDALAELLFVVPANRPNPNGTSRRERRGGGGGGADGTSSAEEREVAAARVWLGAFWATMAREWAKLDVYRLEKFMLLVRRVLGASLVWMRRGTALPPQTRNKAQQSHAPGDGEEGVAPEGDRQEHEWDATRSDEVLTLLSTWPLNPSADPDLSSYQYETELWAKEGPSSNLLPKTNPVGMKLHVLDIWVDEVDKAGLAEAEKGSQGYELLERINGLVDKLAVQTHSTAVKIRSKEALADERLPWNKAQDVEDDAGSWDGLED